MVDLILVDEQDRQIGVCEKLAAHQHGGKLHRCFSTIILNSKGEMLIQQRAAGKYHSAGKWANACCSHPIPGEDAIAGGQRRLTEELGLGVRLHEIGTFIYRAELDHGLTEHEFDHVLLGRTDATPQPNPEEVQACRWVAIDQLHDEVTADPERFAIWFRIMMEKIGEKEFVLQTLR
jgi:isopentenyl-diphosphate delta-isomerase